MTSPDDVIARLIAELRSDFPARPDCWQDEAPGWAKDPFNDDYTGKCGKCGSWLEVVRAGKSQCPACGSDSDRANRWKAAAALQDNASLIKALTRERDEAKLAAIHAALQIGIVSGSEPL